MGVSGVFSHGEPQDPCGQRGPEDHLGHVGGKTSGARAVICARHTVYIYTPGLPVNPCIRYHLQKMCFYIIVSTARYPYPGILPKILNTVHALINISTHAYIHKTCIVCGKQMMMTMMMMMMMMMRLFEYSMCIARMVRQ